ncbi:hypothetical protein [Roseateles sp.]|uniref:hypothetical protein n=1 Tax=Roseateles sp. TaxID=1971397 RepID=UPI0039E0FCD8
MSMNLYVASVPVFQCYLGQLRVMLDLAQARIDIGALTEPERLAARPAPGCRDRASRRRFPAAIRPA